MIDDYVVDYTCCSNNDEYLKDMTMGMRSTHPVQTITKLSAFWPSDVTHMCHFLVSRLCGKAKEVQEAKP